MDSSSYFRFDDDNKIKQYILDDIITIKHLQWRRNERSGVSNHRGLDCLLDRLFRKKTSKLRVTGTCEGIQRWPVDSPHKGPVTRKMSPFDYVIMQSSAMCILCGIYCTVPTLFGVVNRIIIPDSKVHGAHLGPIGPRWAPCWPQELCYLGLHAVFIFVLILALFR